MPNPAPSRRTLLATLTLGAAALLARGRARADAPKLDEKDPAAQALGYVEDASRVDVRKYPAFVPGSICENCLQLQGAGGERYRPCALFPGKLVAIGGWCSGWTAEI